MPWPPFSGPGSDSGPSFCAGRVGRIVIVEAQTRVNAIYTVVSAIVSLRLGGHVSVSFCTLVQAGPTG